MRARIMTATLALNSADMFDLPRPAPECRIVVAMSGGVDSSVVAALAAASGAEVIGITLQLYDFGAATGRKGACCAGDDIRDALNLMQRYQVRRLPVIDGQDLVGIISKGDVALALSATETAETVEAISR